MSCQETRDLLDAYVDGELDLVRSLEFEHHLRECSRCRALLDEREELRPSLRRGGLYFQAPVALEEKIRLRINGTRKPSSITSRPKSGPVRWWIPAIAAGVLAVVLSTVALVEMLERPSASEVLAQQVLSSHIRSLMANHLTDVFSTDQHTVKPWFAGKLDFAPVVKDLTPEGFPLAGGRLDYMNKRPVAALVYKRHQHIINLFIWPSPQSDSNPEAISIRGYNLVHWTQSTMTYWAVSDLNARELIDFVRDQQK